MANTPRYQDRREALLGVAARIFAENGYHRATMRDIARGAGSSLAGLYYYFPTKEEILFEVSARTLDTVIEGARASTELVAPPEERLRQFVRSHLSYFAQHLTEMKVLSHESDSLSGEFRQRIQERKRAYVSLATAIVSGLRADGRPARHGGSTGEPRVAALSLFGMMNWIYTWYRGPGDGDHMTGEDPGIESIAEMMSEIFLRGFVRAEEAIARPAGAGADSATIDAPERVTINEKG